MLRALIKKEWRENRWLIVGFLVMAPILSLGMKVGLIGWTNTNPEDSMCVFLPGMLLLFLLAVGADLVAAESGSGRIAFLAALPVRPTKIWLAKGSFLGLSGALFLVYLLAVEAAILSLGGKDPAGIISSRSMRWAWHFVPVLTAGAAVFAFSTVLDRGLTVVLAALVALGLFTGIGWVLTWSGVQVQPGRPGFAPACGLLAAGFIGASWAPFAFGRVHLGARLRRACCAAAGFLAIMLPATTWAGVRTHQWLTIDVTDNDYRIGLANVDPQGEWVVLRPYRPHRDAPSWITPPSALWAIRLRDGKVLDLSQVAKRFGEFIESRPGHVRVHLWRIEDRRWGRGASGLRVEYDLEAERVLSTCLSRVPHPVTGQWWHGDLEFRQTDESGVVFLRYTHPTGRSLVLPASWYPCGSYRNWGTLLSSRLRKRGIPLRHGWMDFSGNAVLPLSMGPTLVPRERAEWAWGYEWPGRSGNGGGYRVFRISLRTGERSEISGGPFRRLVVSDERPWELISNEDGLWWLQAGHPEPHRLGIDLPDEPGTELRLASSSTRPLVYVTNGEAAFRITPGEAGPIVERAPHTHAPRHPFWFDGDRWLERDPKSCRLRYGRIGRWTRTLLPTHGETD